MIFGAVLLGPALKHVSWQIALYAVLSLTLVRMVPVAVAMIGTGARRPTVGFLGWFGPRGLASIVFAVIVVEEAHLPGAPTILTTTYVTIGLSVLAHGMTAAPFAKRYARWYEGHRRTASRRWKACRCRTTASAGRRTQPPRNQRASLHHETRCRPRPARSVAAPRESHRIRRRGRQEVRGRPRAESRSPDCVLGVLLRVCAVAGLRGDSRFHLPWRSIVPA